MDAEKLSKTIMDLVSKKHAEVTGNTTSIISQMQSQLQDFNNKMNDTYFVKINTMEEAIADLTKVEEDTPADKPSPAPKQKPKKPTRSNKKSKK